MARDEYRVQCAWCRRMLIDGRWVEGEPDPDEIVSHGMCPACGDAMEALIDNMAVGDDEPDEQ